jgi:hypothetical protein
MRYFFLTCALGFVVLVSNNAVAATVYTSDFAADSTGSSDSSFSSGVIVTTPNGTNILAGLGPGGSTTLTLTGLASHTEATLSFTLDVVGSMDGGPASEGPVFGGGNGDYFDVAYASASTSGNTNVFDYTFANYGGGETQSYPVLGSAPVTGAATVNGLGYTNQFPTSDPDVNGVPTNVQDAEYDITLTPIVDSNGTISFTFTDNSNEGASNEFYGIDNVVVTTDAGVSSTPEPATFALVGLGLCFLPVARRWKSRA